VNVVAKATIVQMMKQHADAAKELGIWYKIAKKARWDTLSDVREQLTDADQVRNVLIFNIRQNKYRLIVKADLKMKILMVKALLTHKEYERGEWKKWA
jgi:mRNA interferase HigB